MKVLTSVLITLLLINLNTPCFARNVVEDGDPVLVDTVSGTARPSADATITRYDLEPAGSTFDAKYTSIHIFYTDRTEVTAAVPAKKVPSNPDPNADDNDLEKIDDPALADDKKTLGWVEEYGNCCQSYAIPLTLVIYRDGEIIQHIQQGQTVWFWEFLNGGKTVAVIWGATHGPEVGDYQLYDVKTGKMIAEVFGDNDLQALSSDAPKWAKQVEGDWLESERQLSEKQLAAAKSHIDHDH